MGRVTAVRIVNLGRSPQSDFKQESLILEDHLKVTLSNNAIKFLQAQYRAIFKRAYVKGLATAVLLTAGLAAGQAQAVELSTDKNNPTSDLVIATGTTQEFGVSAQYATSVTVNAGGTFSSATTVNNDFHFSDSMDVYGTVKVTSGHGIVGTFDDEAKAVTTRRATSPVL